MFVLHERLKPDRVEARSYQLALAEAAAREPLLLVLPTGLGKTAVALLAILRRMDARPEARVLVLAPTKPLVEQHARFFEDVFIPDVRVESLTGEVDPAARAETWRRATIVCATPQAAHNDVIRGTLDLGSFDTLILDEAHRGVGNYPYVFLAARFGGHRLGLSASPGTDLPTIRKVLENLRLTRTEVRTETDADVKEYVHDVQTQWVRVNPNAELVQTAKLLQRSLADAVIALRRLGFLDHVAGQPTRKQLLEIGSRLRAEASRSRARPNVYSALSLHARALKIEHALELCETQGPGQLARFLERTLGESERAGGSKAARDWVATEEFAKALTLAKAAKEPHPKVRRLLEIVGEQLSGGSRRVLVFANFRETAEELVSRLGEVPGVRVDRFVGHSTVAAGKGLTKKAQQRVVDAFRQGDVNVLVATSVGEEGLDLPECDAVVLFEPVASGIRMIQRRGRTGRRRDGQLFVLITEGTRDAAYYWSARRREKRMATELRNLRRAPPAPVEAAVPLAAPSAATPASAAAAEVVVDTREFQSPLVRRLLADGLRVKAVQMETGDYRLGADVTVERKSAADLAASIVDGRFFDQVPRLAAQGRGLLLIEGRLDATGKLSRSAMAGALASAYLDHGVGVVAVADSEAAADVLAALARRTAKAGSGVRLPRGRAGRVPTAPEALVRHLFEGLPGVGPVTAERLRVRFGSMAALCAASVEELAGVDGVGPKRARDVHDALRAEAASIIEPDPAQGLALKAGDGSAG